MERVYTEVNNGVYRCGFAGSQASYDAAYDRLWAAMDWLEERLADRRYLMGDVVTEADVRLFTTLVRFDAVYHGHFKCNRQQAHRDAGAVGLRPRPVPDARLRRDRRLRPDQASTTTSCTRTSTRPGSSPRARTCPAGPSRTVASHWAGSRSSPWPLPRSTHGARPRARRRARGGPRAAAAGARDHRGGDGGRAGRRLGRGSLALLADAGHMATDAAAIVLALGASYVATRPAGPRSTFGWHRAEILAALVNALVLLVVCGYLAYAGISRLVDPQTVEAGPMIAFALVGLARQRGLAGDPEPVATPGAQPARRRHRGARRPGRLGARRRGRRGHLAHRLPARRPDRLAGDRGADPAAVAAPAAGLGGRSCSRSRPTGLDLDDVRDHLPACPASSTSTTCTPGRSPAGCQSSPRTSPSPTRRSREHGVGGILDRLCRVHHRALRHRPRDVPGRARDPPRARGPRRGALTRAGSGVHRIGPALPRHG